VCFHVALTVKFFNGAVYTSVDPNRDLVDFSWAVFHPTWIKLDYFGLEYSSVDSASRGAQTIIAVSRIRIQGLTLVL
jgi:hypothetical protein